MKELLSRLLRYNIWANSQFIEVLRTLCEEQLDKEIISSFPSIRKTVYHMWGAEDIWLQRLELVERPIWKALAYEGSIAQACEYWKEASSGLLKYAASVANDAVLETVIPVTSLKGQHFEDAIGDVLQHVANHSTYHRGQLVTMLRQVDVTEIPSTDLIAYARMGAR